jgi:hypothetical protein
MSATRRLEVSTSPLDARTKSLVKRAAARLEHTALMARLELIFCGGPLAVVLALVLVADLLAMRFVLKTGTAEDFHGEIFLFAALIATFSVHAAAQRFPRIRKTLDVFAGLAALAFVLGISAMLMKVFLDSGPIPPTLPPSCPPWGCAGAGAAEVEPGFWARLNDSIAQLVEDLGGGAFRALFALAGGLIFCLSVYLSARTIEALHALLERTRAVLADAKAVRAALTALESCEADYRQGVREINAAFREMDALAEHYAAEVGLAIDEGLAGHDRLLAWHEINPKDAAVQGAVVINGVGESNRALDTDTLRQRIASVREIIPRLPAIIRSIKL